MPTSILGSAPLSRPIATITTAESASRQNHSARAARSGCGESLTRPPDLEHACITGTTVTAMIARGLIQRDATPADERRVRRARGAAREGRLTRMQHSASEMGVMIAPIVEKEPDAADAPDPQPAIANRCTNLQKSGFCAIGTSEYAPGYHWRFSGQTSSSHSSEAKARRNVSVADQGEVKAPSSSTVSWICSPFPL